MSALLGTIVGGLIAFCSSVGATYILDNRKKTLEARSIAVVISGEIGMVCKLIKKRQYQQHIQSHIANLKRDSSTASFSAHVRRSYSKAYDANIQKLGVLEYGLAGEIVEFYGLLNAAIEDIEGVSNGDHDKHSEKTLIDLYTNLDSIIERIMILGEGICTKVAKDCE